MNSYYSKKATYTEKKVKIPAAKRMHFKLQNSNCICIGIGIILDKLLSF